MRRVNKQRDHGEREKEKKIISLLALIKPLILSNYDPPPLKGL